MRPEAYPLRRSAGFGLVAAMFLMIVVSLVIITMARLSTIQHGTTSLAIQQARAYQAARAGLEWGLNRTSAATSCVSGSPSLAGSTLAGFAVAVSCSVNGYTDDDGSAVQIFHIEAVAESRSPIGHPDYAYRKITAVMER